MKKYFVALCLCLLSAGAQADDVSLCPDMIIGGIHQYRPSRIAYALDVLKKDNARINFNDVLKNTLIMLEWQSKNKRGLIVRIVELATGLALTTGGVLYALKSKHLADASFYQLAKEYGLCAISPKHVLGGWFAACYGALVACDAIDGIAVYRRLLMKSNFNGLAATLRQVKDSPACYISDKDFAKHLLAQIRDLAPAVERAELNQLIASI